jgi:hypothetical protein
MNFYPLQEKLKLAILMQRERRVQRLSFFMENFMPLIVLPIVTEMETLLATNMHQYRRNNMNPFSSAALKDAKRMRAKKELITIGGHMYEVLESVANQLREHNASGEYDKQNRLMEAIQQSSKDLGYVSGFYYN